MDFPGEPWVFPRKPWIFRENYEFAAAGATEEEVLVLLGELRDGPAAMAAAARPCPCSARGAAMSRVGAWRPRV